MLAGETEGARKPHDATWDPTVEEREPAAMVRNRVYAFAGTSTLIQALGQTLYTSLALAQHFCLIDFLKEFHILIYLRILYFHNPSTCGQRINIGEAIDGIANQAFVLLSHEPFTAFRTCIINCIGLGLSVVWITASIIFMKGAAYSSHSKHVKWPWVTVTVAMCALDLVATITYTNDSFHTRTLSDTMDFIGGTVTGVGNVELNTSWASWTMVLFYSRFIVFFFMNVILLVMVIVDNVEHKENVAVQVEAPTMVHTSVTAQAGDVSDPDSENVSSLNLRSASRIPRPGLSQSFRKMKTLLFGRSFTLDQQSRSDMDSLDMSPETSRTVPVELDKKRTVNFPDNLLSLPQRLENMIAEQQRRLNKAVVNTAGRAPADTSANMDDVSVLIEGKSRHNMKNMELQGQLPWAYIPASSHPMRDQLPPDEDLPPVPLPDYTAMPSVRKASVHRAASSLSSLTQKRGYLSAQHGDDEDF